MNIYDLIHNTDNKTLFNYIIILVLIIFIFKNITISSGIILSIFVLIVCFIYMYEKKDKTTITKTKKENLKYDDVKIALKNKLLDEPLNEYPEIIDYLFYLYPFSQYNNSLYDDIVNYFINFVNLYKNCKTNSENINYNYFEMERIKIKTVLALEDFILMNADEKSVKQLKINAQEIFNKYLEILKIEYNKKLYYNGYNNITHIIDENNVIAHNFFNSQNQNLRGTEIISFQNMLSA